MKVRIMSRDINKAKLRLVDLEGDIAEMEYRMANPVPETPMHEYQRELGAMYARRDAVIRTLRAVGIQIDL